jgi:alpha-mannosidase
VEINARDATYDMAYGNMTRPTHRNTSLDEARFEVPAHKWMDLSEEGYGVSLLNDCKYGHEAHGNVMRLTLLKGPIYPDADSDMGEHTFTYCLYPHAGRWREARTVQLALNLNHPCFTSPTGVVDTGSKSWMSCRSDHVTLEAVKCSEDGQHLIVRLAEQHGSRQPIELEFGRPIRRVWSCNLMEEIEQELRSDEQRVQVSIKPFEVVTLRILPGSRER